MQKPATYLGKPSTVWIDLLAREDPLLRRLGAYALGEIGPEARDAMTLLTVALDDPVSWVRVWAAEALARIDPANPRSAHVLRQGLKDEKAFVRSLAAWHLARLDPGTPGRKESIPFLKELTGDENPSVCKEAALALKHIQGTCGAPSELEAVAEKEKEKAPTGAPKEEKP